MSDQAHITNYVRLSLPVLTIGGTWLPDGVSNSWRSIAVAAQAPLRHESRVRACVVQALHRAAYDITRRTLAVSTELLDWVGPYVGGGPHIEEWGGTRDELTQGVDQSLVTTAAVLLRLERDYQHGTAGGYECTARTAACAFASRRQAVGGDAWTAAIGEATARLWAMVQEPTPAEQVRIVADHIAILCAAAAHEAAADDPHATPAARVGYEVSAMAALQWIERMTSTATPSWMIDHNKALDAEVLRLAGAIRQGPHYTGRRLDRQALRLLGGVDQHVHVEAPAPRDVGAAVATAESSP